MDLLLSLPIVSYFLAPSVTSWSTSLNLLFFYMTWSTLILSHSPLKIELLGGLGVRTILWLLPSLIFLSFDAFLPTIAESLKVGGRSGLPPTGNRRLMLRTLLLVLLNLVLWTALEAGISIGWTFIFQEPVFKSSTTLPLPWQLIKHLGMLFVGREALTYYLHSHFLHGSQFYTARMHKQHAHCRKAPPFSLQLYADHPVSFLLHRFVPLYLPALALRPHLLTYFLYFSICTMEETFSMSGYSTVPGILMGGIARRTSGHYASGGQVNYGALGLLDWAHGTTAGRDVMEDIHEEAEKHAVKERTQAAADEGTSAVKEGIEGLRKGRGKGGKKKNGE